MKSSIERVKEIKTHCVTYGSGEKTIVFLHGWGGSTESFSRLAPSVAKQHNCKCLVLDLPGFGKSDMPPTKGWFIANYEQWLCDFLENQNIKNPIFYGHSFGCRIIVDYLLKHPEHKEKVILTGAAGITWPPTLREKTSKFLSKKLAFTKKFIPEKIYKLILRKVLKAHDWADVSENLKATFQNTIQEPDFRDQLSRIQNKVLLLWGRNDSYTPIKSGLVFEQNLPHGTLTIFENGRHGIHYTHKEEILKALKKFL